MLCDICNGPLHVVKDSQGRSRIESCPLEPFKKVKSYFTTEFQGIMGRLFFNDNESLLDNDPQSLLNLSKRIPKDTALSSFLKFNKDNSFYVKTGVIQSPLEDFFYHFISVIIDIYYYRRIHFVENNVDAERDQFNYLWLNPTKLRDCFFGNGNEKFKGMTALCTPSLVIYPLGEVRSYENSAWPSAVTDLISQRHSEGKATWVLQTRPTQDCVEVNEVLRAYLMRWDTIELSEVVGAKSDYEKCKKDINHNPGNKSTKDYI